jgi:integrase
VIGTGKSKGKRQAIIPVYEELREVLARIPKRSTTVLTSSKNRPWTTNGLASSFHTAKRDAWPKGDTLHFHDLRGTAATKFYLAGLSEREIAETMGWEEAYVSKIIRRYVSRSAAIEDRIRRLDEARKKG